jgi:hypothetical protein
LKIAPKCHYLTLPGNFTSSFSISSPIHLATPGRIAFELPGDVEDEARITEIILYEKSKVKLIFYNFFCWMTLSLLALLCRWRISARLKWKFTIATIQNASHALIVG